eukprot:3666059-Prymnesium_polylepis.1
MRACSPLASWPPSSSRFTGENASPIMVAARGMRCARVSGETSAAAARQGTNAPGVCAENAKGATDRLDVFLGRWVLLAGRWGEVSDVRGLCQWPMADDVADGR